MYTSVVVAHVYLVLFNVILPLGLLVINVTVVCEVVGRRQRSNDGVGRQRCLPLERQQPTSSSSSNHSAALSAMLLATSLMHVAVCGTWFTLCYVYLWTRHADLSVAAARLAVRQVCLVAEEPQSFVMSTAFYVYFVRGKQFRAELRRLLCQCCCSPAAATASSASRRVYADSGV